MEPQDVVSAYLDDGLSEVHPCLQQAVEVLPLLLQLVLGFLVSHGEDLPTQLQRVQERGLVVLEQLLGVLRRAAGVRVLRRNSRKL